MDLISALSLIQKFQKMNENLSIFSIFYKFKHFNGKKPSIIYPQIIFLDLPVFDIPWLSLAIFGVTFDGNEVDLLK